MPHVPDLAAHATHDRELIAALAAGDATGEQLESAAALVAGCTACAELHVDLRAIAAALPALPVPARTRDFRLSREQAARLRPSGWRRLVATLAGPGFAFATPLGSGLAALGVAGLLLASLQGPLQGGATGAASQEGATGGQAVPYGASRVEAPEPVASAGPALAPAASAAPSAGAADAGGPRGSRDRETASTVLGAVHGASPLPEAAGVPAPAASDNGTPGPVIRETTSDVSPPPQGVSFLAALAALVVVIGVAIVAARWTSRRLA